MNLYTLLYGRSGTAILARGAVAATLGGAGVEVVITGKLDGLTRDLAIDGLVALGVHVGSVVTARTDILITNDPDRQTVKRRAAARLGAAVWDERQFVTWLIKRAEAAGGMVEDTRVLPEIRPLQSLS